MEIDANPHLSESQKAELKNLVIEYSDTFQPSTAGLQQTDYVHHHIDTGNAKPSNSPPYRVSPTERQIISEHIDSMLHDDIISPSQRPWALPVIVVEKKMEIKFSPTPLHLVTKPCRALSRRIEYGEKFNLLQGVPKKREPA